jgi:hypothetical protein
MSGGAGTKISNLSIILAQIKDRKSDPMDRLPNLSPRITFELVVLLL